MGLRGNLVRPLGTVTGIYDTNGTQLFEMSYSAVGKTYLKGGFVSGYDLFVYANAIDGLPYMKFNGLGEIQFYHSTGKKFELFESTTKYIMMYADTDAVIETAAANQHLYLKPNGTGKVKFGTYVAGAATDSTGYIMIKDSGGTDRKVMIQA